MANQNENDGEESLSFEEFWGVKMENVQERRNKLEKVGYSRVGRIFHIAAEKELNVDFDEELSDLDELDNVKIEVTLEPDPSEALLEQFSEYISGQLNCGEWLALLMRTTWIESDEFIEGLKDSQEPSAEEVFQFLRRVKQSAGGEQAYRVLVRAYYKTGGADGKSLKEYPELKALDEEKAHVSPEEWGTSEQSGSEESTEEEIERRIEETNELFDLPENEEGYIIKDESDEDNDKGKE
jgi:hypothetical protein